MSDARAVALATCRDLPGWEVDDAPLHAALAARGCAVEQPSWDDPTVDWARYAAVVIRTTWDYVPRREAFVAWAERVEGQTRLFNPAAVVRANTHKSYLRRLEAAGVPTIPTDWLAPGAPPEVAARLAARGWRRAFLKPAVGATASGTLRFEADAAGLAAAEAHATAQLAASGELLLQPYLEQVETAGERSAIVIDGVVTHAVVKRPVAGDYRVQDDFGGTDAAVALTAAEARVARAALAALGAAELLYARVDLLTGADGAPAVNEVELVEPSLFFRHGPGAAAAFAEALLARLG